MGEFIPPTDGKVTAKSNSDTFVPPTDSVELKKKDESKPTSTPQKSVLGTPTGSSGGVNPAFKSSIPSPIPDFNSMESVKSVVQKPKIKLQKPPVKEDTSFFDYLKENLDTGLATVSKSIYDTPGLVYDAAASITNPMFRAMGVGEDKLASSDKLANDLGFKNIPSEILKEKIKVSNEKINAYSAKNGGDALQAVQDGNYVGAAKLVAGTTAQSLPIMIAAMASGGESMALTAIGVSTASTKNAQLKEENPEMALGTRVLNSANAGIIEAVTGHLFTGASGAVMKKIIADKGVEAGSKIIGKSFRTTIEKSIEKNPLVGAIGEVVEESAVEFGNQVNDMSSGIRTEFDFHAIKNAGLSATGMGGLQTLGVYGAKGYVKAKDYAKLKSTNKEVFKLRSEIDNGNLSDANKAILKLRADRLEAENKKTLGTELEKAKALPTEAKTELNALNAEFEDLKTKFDDIDDADDIPDNLKPAMKEEIKIQAAKNQKRKTEILSQNDGLEVKDDFSKFEGVEPDFDLENGKISSLPLKEQDRLNKLAVEQITGGDKTIEYSKEQVSQTANEIYKNEQTPPTPEAQLQAEVPQQAEAEKVAEVSPVEDVVATSGEEKEIISQNNSETVSLPTGNIVSLWNEKDRTKLRSLATNETTLSKSEMQELSKLRGKRDNYIGELEKQLQSISSRYRGETDAKSFNRQDRQQWKLLQRELQVVNKERTGGKQKEYNKAELQREGMSSDGIERKIQGASRYDNDKNKEGNDSGGISNKTTILQDGKNKISKQGDEVKRNSIDSQNERNYSKKEIENGNDSKRSDDNSRIEANRKTSIQGNVSKEIESEKLSPTNPPTNGNVQLGASNVGESGNSKQESPVQESVSSSVDGGEVKGEAKQVIVDGDDLILNHGTPHNFDKFQLEKIGTGEGAQAFGYGLYFTDGSKIAEGYARKLSEDKTGIVYSVRIKNGRTANWAEWREPLDETQEQDLYNSLTPEERKQYQDHSDKAFDYQSPNYDIKYQKDYHGSFDDLKPNSDGVVDYGNNDKPVSVGSLYSDLKDAFGQEKATEIFKRAGVDGIKYRAKNGIGDNYNYVVFNPESITIESKSIKPAETPQPKSKGDVEVGKQIEPHSEVNTDVETVKKELNLDEVDSFIYDNLNDTPYDKKESKVEQLKDDKLWEIEAIETKINDIDIKIEDNGIAIDKIEEDEKLTPAKKKKAIAVLGKEFKDLQAQQKILEEQKENTENFLKDFEDRLFYSGVDFNDAKIKEVVDKVNNRLETRKSVKEGTNLFPEDANIPEFVAIKKELIKLTDEKTIADFNSRTAEQVKESEPIIADIKSKAKNAERISKEELEKGIADAEKLLKPQVNPKKVEKPSLKTDVDAPTIRVDKVDKTDSSLGEIKSTKDLKKHFSDSTIELIEFDIMNEDYSRKSLKNYVDDLIHDNEVTGDALSEEKLAPYKLAIKEISKYLESAETPNPKPTTKERIAERIKLSDAKVDDWKNAVNGIDNIFGIKIKVDDIEGLNKNGIDIVEVIANIAKQAIAAGIHIDEAISKTIEHLKKTIDFDVNIDDIKERINPKKEAEKETTSDSDMEDFRDSWNLDPSSDEINQYDSGRTIAREHGETRNNQDYEVQKDFARVQIGIRAIEHAKRLFGAEYVEKTLSFIEQANLSPEKKAVAYVLLENEMDARAKEFPKNVGVQKLQDLVRAKSQEFLANSARAMGAGRFRVERFRELAKNGFSEEEFTNAILTTKQKNDKGKIQKLIQVSPDDINNESEFQESDEDFVIEEPTVKRNKEAVKKDISNVLAQMRKDLLKVAKGNVAMSSIPYAAQLQAVAPHIIKLSKLLAELGGMTTRQIVNEVYNDIKEVFPGINKTDVSDILKEHSIKKAKPKTEAQEKQDSVKEIVKKALIEKGFSREITVTKNERDASGKLVKDADGRNVKTKEKRTVLDWKKLAGEAGTISNIRKNVEESLKGSKYSKAEINEMKKALEREYVRLTSDVIEKGLNELQNRNADRKPVNTKSAAKKLAELYNYGLFEKNKDSYEKIINSVLGFNGLDQMAFDEMKEIARGYAVLMDSGLSDTEIKSAVNSLSRRQSRLVATLAFSQADWKFKLAVALSEITNLSTRFKLVNLGNLAENISSGMMARAANNMMDAMANIASGKKTSNKAIKAQSKINARAKLRGITLEAAESYGDTSSLLLNHSAVEDYFNNATTNRVYHAIISTYMAKPVLEGADSYNKILITEAKMVRATIKVLEAKGMSNSDALDYVAKAITGESMKEALVKAKALIEKVNEDAGRKLLNDSESSIKSLAADIVKESLVSGGQLSETELKAIYAAAYKSAGKDIGHVSNNWVTDWISAKGAQIEKRVTDAIQEKKWDVASGEVVNQLFWKNFVSTFVGGGTNWFVKGLQKSANPLSLFSLREDISRLKMAGKLDVTTDEGIKNMEESLYRGMNLRSTSATMLMGAIITASIIGGMSASGADDEIEKWLKENKWAKKYFDKTVPDAVVLMLAIKDKDFGRYIAKMVNVKADFFDDQKNTYKILEKYAKGYTENDEVKISEASGDLGAMLGKRFEFPGPVRAAKDVKQIYKGLVKGEYDKTNYYTSGFLNGFFQGGIVEGLGLRKDPDFEEKSKSYKKGVPGVPNFGRMKINP